jgi:hypothetical protein
VDSRSYEYVLKDGQQLNFLDFRWTLNAKTDNSTMYENIDAYQTHGHTNTGNGKPGQCVNMTSGALNGWMFARTHGAPDQRTRWYFRFRTIDGTRRLQRRAARELKPGGEASVDWFGARCHDDAANYNNLDRFAIG